MPPIQASAGRRRAAFLALAGYACTLCLVSGADARLPPTRQHLIRINKSIGPVALGDSLSTVKRAWPGGQCTLFACSYTVGNSPDALNGVGVEFLSPDASHSGPVGAVDLYAKSSPGVLGRFKTSQGIGLGSTLRQLCKAFPNLLLSRHYDEGTLYAGKVYRGHAVRGTKFEFQEAGNRGSEKIVDLEVVSEPLIHGFKHCGNVH